MKKFLYGSLFVVSIVAGWNIAKAVAEVNIAEVKGEYRAKTIKDALDLRKINSLQLMNEALKQAYLAGYGQAMVDYDIISSSAPAKMRTEEDEESK